MILGNLLCLLPILALLSGTLMQMEQNYRAQMQTYYTQTLRPFVVDMDMALLSAKRVLAMEKG